LNKEEINFHPNKASNSIAIIIQHIHGNMLSRWTDFLTEDGEKNWRKRYSEFENRALSKEQLIQLWDEGWKVFRETMSELSPSKLSHIITIRSQPLTVIDAINRQLAHYSYHIGQIVFIGKWLREYDWNTLSIVKGESIAFNQLLTK
jgi:uncharacterized membrane protein YgaE (UPF0421/DUF939 family)